MVSGKQILLKKIDHSEPRLVSLIHRPTSRAICYRRRRSWLTWELTGSNFWLGAIAFADLFPTIVITPIVITPIAGIIDDRVNRLNMSRLRAAALRLIYPWLHMVTRPGITSNVRCDSEIFRG